MSGGYDVSNATHSVRGSIRRDPGSSCGRMVNSAVGQGGDQARQSQRRNLDIPCRAMAEPRPQRVGMDGRRTGRHELFNALLGVASYPELSACAATEEAVAWSAMNPIERVAAG